LDDVEERKDFKPDETYNPFKTREELAKDLQAASEGKTLIEVSQLDVVAS